MEKVGIYGRMACVDPNGPSINDQIEKCRKHVEKNGGNIVSTFSDAPGSGINKSRPGYQALLQGITERKFDCVIAEDWTRFTRDMVDMEQLDKLCQQYDVQLIALADSLR